MSKITQVQGAAIHRREFLCLAPSAVIASSIPDTFPTTLVPSGRPSSTQEAGMTVLVLISRPKSLHIMIQALAAPSSRESGWRFGRIDTTRLGTRARQWLLAARQQHDVRLVHTRNYIPRQTAFYADWLVFRDDELAAQFLTAFPRFQIPHRREKLRQDRQTIATRMEERLRRGGFDLGRHPAEQRRTIADRFVELDDKLRDIDDHCRTLELAEKFVACDRIGTHTVAHERAMQ
jgi:hypothetical protein